MSNDQKQYKQNQYDYEESKEWWQEKMRSYVKRVEYSQA